METVSTSAPTLKVPGSAAVSKATDSPVTSRVVKVIVLLLLIVVCLWKQHFHLYYTIVTSIIGNG